MDPHKITLHCEPFAPRAGVSGVYHGPWAMEKITVARPTEGRLDQEVRCPACDASLVVRTFPWAGVSIVRRRRKVPILVVPMVIVGWGAVAVLVAPALRPSFALAAVPLLYLWLSMAGRLMEVTGAELRDGVVYDGLHPRHRLDSRFPEHRD